MENVVGMLRVKNEARWIDRCVRSLFPACGAVVILDDHSTDGTPEICETIPGVIVLRSAFDGVHEVRDKNYLQAQVLSRYSPEWIVCTDGDEMLDARDVDELQALMTSPSYRSLSFPIPYYWDDEKHVRVDGIYGRFSRASAYRPSPGQTFHSGYENGFHCSNAPLAARGKMGKANARLFHFGYMHAEDRLRKYAWYNALDPVNRAEDCYRHIVAGMPVSHAEILSLQVHFREELGLPPLHPSQYAPPAPLATQKTMHAGPLTIQESRQ